MDRDIPNFNPIVVSRMQQKQLQLHQQRLQNIKSFNQSRVTTSAHHHTRQNRKALQLEEDKKTQIERNNLILFNKMLKIMKRSDPCNRAGAPANRVNARTSVQLNRIQEQNRTMYERIEKQKPTIDNRKLYEQRKKQENILRFLGKYSAHSLQNAQTQSMRCEQPKEIMFNPQRRTAKPDHYLYKLQNEEMGLEKPVRYEQIELEDELDEEQFNRHMRAYNNRSKKSYSTNHTTNQISNKPEIPVSFESLQERKVPTSAKDIILFNSTKEIAGQKYEMRIVRSHLAYEVRATAIGEDLEDPAKLVLSENAGNQLLEENDYDYKRIVAKVGLRGTQLILLQGDPDQSEDHQEEKQDEYPVEQFIRSRPKEIYFNPSHISEQNEEDSYRPADSLGYSPAKNNQRVDSLGAAQNQNIYIQQGERHETQEDCMVENEKINQACYTEQAKKPAQQEYYKQEKGEGGQREEEQGMANFESKYEQALDEQIM